MKIFVIGDPHFKVGNVKDTDQMVAKILEHARDICPDLIVNLGDTLDRHESIHVNPFKRATDFMFELSQIAPTVMLIGNHDRPNNSIFLTDDHPFNSLKEWKNMLVADKVCFLRIKGYHLVFVPFVPPGRFQEAMDTYTGPDPHLIFAHQEFYNAKMGAVVSINGDKWDTSKPYVISGHIHEYDQLQENILYVGTPIQHGFNEKQNKVVIVVHLNDDQMRIEKINLNIARKTTLTVTPKEFLETDLSKYLDDKIDLRVIIKGTTEEIAAVIKHPKIKKITGAVKILYEDISEIPEINTISFEPGETFLTLLSKRCETDMEKEVFEEIFKGR